MARNLKIKLDYDIAKAQEKQKKLIHNFNEQQRKVEDLNREQARLNRQLEEELAIQDKIDRKRNSQGWKIRELEQEQRRRQSPRGPQYNYAEDIVKYEHYGSDMELAEKLNNAKIEAGKLDKEFDKNYNSISKIEGKIQSTNSKLAVANSKLNIQGDKIKENASKIKSQTSSWGKVNSSVSDSAKSIEKLGKRIGRLATRVFIFSVITKAFRAMREQMGNIISKDKEMMKDWNQIKVNLIAIGFQLYDIIKPVIKWLLDAVNTLTQVLSFLLQTVFGKGAKSAKEIADSMKETAESAEKTTASFDTINTLNSKEKDSSGTDFSTAKDIRQKTVDELTLIGTLTGYALLGIGLILLLTGANIPLGLAMSVSGAIIIYKTKKENWDKLNPKTKAKLVTIGKVVGYAMVGIGLLLALSGVAIPLGIGLMAAGGAIAYKAHQDEKYTDIKHSSIPEETNAVLTLIGSVAGVTMIALGLILLCTGVGIPLGLGLILEGALVVYGSYAKDPKAFSDMFKNSFKSFEEWILNETDYLFQDLLLIVFDLGYAVEEFLGYVLGGIFDLFKGDWELGFKKIMVGIVNLVTGVFNIIIDALNGVLSPVQMLLDAFAESIGVSGWTSKIPRINYVDVNTPWLASGAVIPGGKPFTAVLGDQPKGQTNIEAPLSTIEQAVANMLDERLNDVPIILNVDAQKVASAIYRPLQKMNKTKTVFAR